MTTPKTIDDMKDVFLRRYVTKEDYHNANVSLDGIITTHNATLLTELERRIEGKERPMPYKIKSPFPGEGVEYHLRTYGHIPEIGCCKYDQYTEDECENYNTALTDALAIVREVLGGNQK